jgi:hypothetical protein
LKITNPELYNVVPKTKGVPNYMIAEYEAQELASYNRYNPTTTGTLAKEIINSKK